VAILKGVEVQELARITTENFASLFHIDPSRLQSADRQNQDAPRRAYYR
jgi:TatD DNase family protein